MLSPKPWPSAPTSKFPGKGSAFLEGRENPVQGAALPTNRQYRESQPFAFCTTGRWTVGERVARDGSGLLGAWRRQITQFNRVSGAVADAVVSAFPSPRLLQQAFAACSTEEDRLQLLADLPVQADKDTADEGISTRRVGPDLARRIFLFFTATQPNLLLDLGS